MIPRIVVPFAPLLLPKPGDRPFRRAKQIVADVLLSIVRASKATADEGDDVISRGRIVPELRDDPAATGADEDEEMVRQPEQVRRMMSSYQKGTRRGRTEAARLLGDDDAPEAGPGPEADEQQAT
ncbi:hypothetical protein [Micromonospora avicenniae]|uniref:hypothetical protein n=1 Tax=Micromonospora avicenniae TaxID=1198245 RepID=UPI003317BCD3